MTRELSSITGEDGKTIFTDTDGFEVLCAFNLEHSCTPDCIACNEIIGGRISCLRIGEEIGYIKS